MFAPQPTPEELTDWGLEEPVERPDTPRPSEHPGPTWQDNDYLNYLVEIAVERGTDEMVKAPFVRYVWKDTPTLEATMGRGCPIYTMSLKAKPVDQPLPLLSYPQQHLFADQQCYTLLVDKALDKLSDLSVKADVLYLREQEQQALHLAGQMARTQVLLDNVRWHARDARARLAAANAYERTAARVRGICQHDTTTEKSASKLSA
jgi:hypothetical protein